MAENRLDCGSRPLVLRAATLTALADHCHGIKGQRRRFPIAHRADGHYHTPWRAALPHLWGARPVRTDPDTRTDQSRHHCGQTAGATRWSSASRAVDAEKLKSVIAALESGTSKAAVCRAFGIPRSNRSHNLYREVRSPSLNSSVHTLKLFSVLGPKVVLIGTSAASRPRAISTRPMRGVLFRASKVYQ